MALDSVRDTAFFDHRGDGPVSSFTLNDLGSLEQLAFAERAVARLDRLIREVG